MRPVSVYIWVFAYSMAFDLDTWYLFGTARNAGKKTEHALVRAW